MGAALRSNQKGQILFQPGEPPRAVFFPFRRARFKTVSVVSEQGKETVVAIPRQGRICRRRLPGGGRASAFRRSMRGPMPLSRVSKRAAILRLIHEDPSFSKVFIAHLLSRAVRVEAAHRPTVQFERETPGANPSASGQFRSAGSLASNPRSPKSARRRSPQMVGTDPGPRPASFMNKVQNASASSPTMAGSRSTVAC